MKKIFIIGISLFLIFNTSFAFEDGDWQSWPRISIEGKLSAKWKIYLDEEFRMGDNISDLYFHRSDFGVTYKFADCFYLGLNYWHSHKEKNGQWYQEKKPHINLTFKWEMGKFKLNDRNRFENRYQQGKDKVWRYRNRLTLTPPLKFTKYNIQPYLADEIFFDFEESELNRNRIYAGIKIKLLKNLSFDGYYLLESNKKFEEWSAYNVMGSKFKVTF